MYERLGQLYSSVEVAEQPTELFPKALKELGFAAEELQVATEELRQQNEQITLNLADAELQARQYRSLFDDSPHAQLITTPAGKIEAANHAATRLLRVSPAYLLDRLLIRFIPLSGRTAFRNYLARLHQFQQPQSWVSNVQLQTGELSELVFTGTLVKTDDLATIRWTLHEAAPLRAALMQADFNGGMLADVQAPQNATELDRYPKYRYAKGDLITLTPQTVCFVVRGLVKLTTLTANNEEVLLELAGCNTPFLLGSARLLTYQAIALTDVEIIGIAIEDAQTHLATLLLPKFFQRLEQTEAMLHVAGQRRTKDRLYHLLRLLAVEAGEPIADGLRISVRLTHEDLANACCTTRVTVTRLLGDFQRQQKIRFDHKFHIILRSNF
ncbi:helix-turn-helix domain-containing protein [Microcoleus sp. FACHB-1515]|uniref:helix-turn-helix domain-containing protein n=1 Tax=Cyanophyceae TaxID=3028117 RepID=UPI0016839160|nr:helix-turn-helix domain-containing protein [Microcoleus sp. FACHB-1515]